MKRPRDILFAAVVIVAIIAGFVYSSVTGIDQIPDSNGPEDYSLAVITEAEIAGDGVKQCVGGPNTKTSKTSIAGLSIGSGTTYYSKQFSGISLLESWNLMLRSDLVFNLYEYEVTGGNFLMCIVHDGQIIATVEPTEDGQVMFCMEDVEPGLYELYIAGESAAFSFMSTDFE